MHERNEKKHDGGTALTAYTTSTDRHGESSILSHVHHESMLRSGAVRAPEGNTHRAEPSAGLLGAVAPWPAQRERRGDERRGSGDELARHGRDSGVCGGGGCRRSHGRGQRLGAALVPFRLPLSHDSSLHTLHPLHSSNMGTDLQYMYTHYTH